MERAKPIEAGCRALILTGRHDAYGWAGMIVKVLERSNPELMRLQFGSTLPSWVVDIPSERGHCYVDEIDLLRIDDEDPDAVTEKDKEVTV